MINHIPVDTLRISSDNTVAYLTITSTINAKYLQYYLDNLAKWEGKWKITFHSDKCNVPSVT